jgi:sterol desaturase/sphingolipid hydroxylase (fatty acid hydroxylase superfamily)
MTEARFQLFKGIAVVASFFLVALLQWLAPYAGRWREIFRNWKVNLPLAFLNVVMMGVVCGGCACKLARYAESKAFGLTHWLNFPLAAGLILSLFALDFVAYAWHRANHRFPFLWRFHSVHHSDRVFDSTTALRFHPGELLISLGVRLAVVGALGLPVLGILGFEMIYAFANLFEHGDIRLPSWLERIADPVFVTPALHRKHHSTNVKEHNRNFGTIFSFWDRFFATLIPSRSSDKIAVGLSGVPADPFRLSQLLLMPAVNPARS